MGFDRIALYFHNLYYGIGNLKAEKSPDAIQLGVLGAASFSPGGLSDAARTHSDVVITAIGARVLEKAQAQAKEYGIPRAHGSYQEVIELDDVDAACIPLPIAYHAEWAIKAARAGKHVLVEKPICSNEERRSVAWRYHWRRLVPCSSSTSFLRLSRVGLLPASITHHDLQVDGTWFSDFGL